MSSIMNWYYTIFGVLSLSLLGCSGNDSGVFPGVDSGGVIGTGGSLARFTIVQNYLYAVDNAALTTIDITNPSQMVLENQQNVGFGIETIFPFDNTLFIGSNTGAYIYGIDSDGIPSELSFFEHAMACDPVVSDGDYAYVTIRSGRACDFLGDVNILEIYDIASLENPIQITQVAMNNPRGLSVDGDLLFVCDGNQGLVIFDVTDRTNPVVLSREMGFEANDVIAQNNIALVVSPDGIRQFDYTDPTSLTELSNLAL